MIEDIVRDLKGKVPDEVVHSNFDGGSEHEHKMVLRLRTNPIAIGIPMDELMFSKFFENFLGIDYMPWDNIITTASTYLPSARNQIHNVFLNKTNASHLFMMDSDNLPPPRVIETLLSHQKDMIGGWYVKKEKYPLRGPDGQTIIIQRPLVYDFLKWQKGAPLYSQRTAPGNGLESVDGTGAGCWLMSRKVAEALGESPYSMAEGAGEDLMICRKIKDKGFDIWVDWNVRVAHAGVFYV